MPVALVSLDSCALSPRFDEFISNCIRALRALKSSFIIGGIPKFLLPLDDRRVSLITELSRKVAATFTLGYITTHASMSRCCRAASAVFTWARRTTLQSALCAPTPLALPVLMPGAGGRSSRFPPLCILWLRPKPCPRQSTRSGTQTNSHASVVCLTVLLLQVGSIIPGNAPVVMGMPDTFFDDDTLIQRMVVSTHCSALFYPA